MRLALIICLFTLASAAGAQNTTPTITYNTGLYSIDFPSTWGVDTTRRFGTDVIFFTAAKDANDKFTENVNVILQDWKGQAMTLAKFKDLNEKEIRKDTKRKLLESVILKKGNDSYYKYTSTTSQEGRPLKTTSICMIKNNVAYVLTYTAEEKEYTNYLTDANKLMASLTIK